MCQSGGVILAEVMAINTLHLRRQRNHLTIGTEVIGMLWVPK